MSRVQFAQTLYVALRAPQSVRSLKKSLSTMVDNDTVKRIEDTALQILTPLGFDLVEAKHMRVNHSVVVRLLVDRLEGGIALDECAQLNKRIGAALDENKIINQRYTLEIFSPGLDRDLVEPKDFRRVLNRLILVFLKEAHESTTQIQGTLQRVDDDGIYITDKKGKETYITFTAIHKAKQVII